MCKYEGHSIKTRLILENVKCSMKRDHKSAKLILQEREKTELGRKERFLVFSLFDLQVHIRRELHF